MYTFMLLQSVDTYTLECTRLCFSLTVNEILTPNPVDVECVLIGILVLHKR